MQDLTSASNRSFGEQLAALDRAWVSLSRAIMRRRGASSEEADLTGAQYVALREIRERGPLRMRDLAEALAVVESTASRTVDRLVDAGLVTRRSEPTDRRTVMVEATLRGRRLLARVRRRRSAHMSPVLRRLSPAERAELVRLMEKLAALAAEPRARAEESGGRR